LQGGERERESEPTTPTSKTPAASAEKIRKMFIFKFLKKINIVIIQQLIKKLKNIFKLF
jgi:hypothetical protein